MTQETLKPAHPAEEAGPPVLHVDAGIATIRLRRPAHMNRLDKDDLRTLQAQFREIDADPTVRVLVLTGTGRVFCAGYHLGELGESEEAAPDGPGLFEDTVQALESLSLPTICRFNGSVYGGATDLALACDFRVGVLGMELRMPAARLGLHYYPSGLRRYVAHLGLQASKQLFLLARKADADDLLRIGYLDELVGLSELDSTVRHWTDALAAGAPLAVRGMKCSLNEIATGRAVEATLREREARCAHSDDLREGVKAWTEKRTPLFEGR
jgi:enoyl-CoA hydratase/carnithine racemase